MGPGIDNARTLLDEPGKAIERDDLLDRVWGHRHVTPGVLNRVVAQLRKAFGDEAEHPLYIQTLHGLGYRFMGEVERIPAQVPHREAPREPAASEPYDPATGLSGDIDLSLPAFRSCIGSGLF